MEQIRDLFRNHKFARDWKELDKNHLGTILCFISKKIHIYLVCLILQEVN